MMVYQQQGIEAIAQLRRYAFGQKWQFDFTAVCCAHTSLRPAQHWQDTVDVSTFESSEGRLFRSEGLVVASPDDLYRFLYEDFDNQARGCSPFAADNSSTRACGTRWCC